MKHWKDFIGLGCWALIINQDNQVLLIQRNAKWRDNIWFWSQPWWTVELWESVQNAIKREIKEELWIDVQLLKYLCYTDTYYEKDSHWIAITYLAKIQSWEPKLMEAKKHSWLKWFDVDKIPDKITPRLKDAVETYKGYLKV